MLGDDGGGVARFERLCEVLYTSPTSSERKDAEAQLLQFQASTGRLAELLAVFEKSHNSYALLIAGTSLQGLLAAQWSALSPDERLEIRMLLMNYLLSRGAQVADFVAASLVKVVARITKLAWFDGARHREVVDEASKLYNASPEHCALALRLLTALVDEFNTTSTTRSDARSLTQQRKCAVSFRDLALFPTVQIAQSTLRRLRTSGNHTDGAAAAAASPTTSTAAASPQDATIAEHALKLLEACLNFDFIGTNADESGDDVGTIQLPSTWRPVAHDPELTATLFEYFRSAEPPRSSSAMQSLVLLSSVRRSLFATEADRGRFLNQLMRGIRDILASRMGLQHEANYHEFCRLLGRLKSNYQLSELVTTDVYSEWLDLASKFTTASFDQWQLSKNSIQYLLTLWGRLVAAVPYAHRAVTSSQSTSNHDTADSTAGTADDDAETAEQRRRRREREHLELLERCVLDVATKYIEAMITSVHVVDRSDGAVDDPLDDEGGLKDQLDRLPVLCRFRYAAVARFLGDGFDATAQNYERCLAAETQAGSSSPHQQPQSSMRSSLERQLAWLAYVIAAVVGGVSWNQLPLAEGEEALDAALARRAFALIEVIDVAHQAQPETRCDARLELAVLYFLTQFRRVYLWETTTTTTRAVVGGSASMLPDVRGTASRETIVGYAHAGGPPLSAKQKAFANLFERMGLGDATAVTNRVVSKIANNLRFWPDDEHVVAATLSLFHELAASGAPSTKVLLDFDATRFLLERRAAPESLPFVARARPRHRTTLHATLARLVLAVVDDTQAAFAAFVEPLLATLAQLRTTAPAPGSPGSAHWNSLCVGVLRDLRGVAQAATTRRAYVMLFEALYPDAFEVLARAAEVTSDRDVLVALLRLVQELVSNKGQRITFDRSSPNGILLFREASRVVVAFGSKELQARGTPPCFRDDVDDVLGAPARGLGSPSSERTRRAKPPSSVLDGGHSSNGQAVGSDEYKRTHKAVVIALSAVSKALDGNYVNLGVFALYNDRALDDMLEVAVRLKSRRPPDKFCGTSNLNPRLTLAAPIEDILAFPKLAVAYFTFYEVLFREHVAFVLLKDSETFATILAALHDALEVPHLAASAASTLDHLATYRFSSRTKPQLAPVRALDAHLASRPHALKRLLATILNQLLFGPPANHWVLTRPVLSLMLVDERGFVDYRDDLLASQHARPDLRQRLSDAFGTLVANVHRSLEPSNRDNFTQALSTFRHDVRQFLVC